MVDAPRTDDEARDGLLFKLLGKIDALEKRLEAVENSGDIPMPKGDDLRQLGGRDVFERGDVLVGTVPVRDVTHQSGWKPDPAAYTLDEQAFLRRNGL